MRTRLYVASIFGALALLAVTLVVVIAFGRHNPSPPLLKDNPRPEIPGRILYEGRDGCFVVAQASGAGEEHFGCAIKSGPIGSEFWWTDDNTVQWVHRTGPTDGKIIETNIQTGELRDTGETFSGPEFPTQGQPRFPGQFDCIEGPDGTFGCINEDGSLTFAKGDQVTTVAEFDLPEYNRPHMKGWSPDGQWVVLEYYPQRADGPELWIVSRDGSVRGTLATDVSFTRIAWRIDGVGTWPPVPD
jgi:hypothetical protein